MKRAGELGVELRGRRARRARRGARRARLARSLRRRPPRLAATTSTLTPSDATVLAAGDVGDLDVVVDAGIDRRRERGGEPAVEEADLVAVRVEQRARVGVVRVVGLALEPQRRAGRETRRRTSWRPSKRHAGELRVERRRVRDARVLLAREDLVGVREEVLDELGGRRVRRAARGARRRAPCSCTRVAPRHSSTVDLEREVDRGLVPDAASSMSGQRNAIAGTADGAVVRREPQVVAGLAHPLRGRS